jgi:hypothetical protein
MAVITWDVDQGSVDWYRLRSGIPTASEFDQVITPAKGLISERRHKYACRIIAGRLLNWQADSLDKIAHIADGKRNEPIAVARLELIHDIATKPIGFVRTNDLRFGASPDRVVMSQDKIGITIEVKAPTIPTQLYYLLFGHEDNYKCQVNGQLWVAEADKAIFMAYNERTPDYRVETGRDEPFIKKMVAGLEQFSDELDALMERAISLGTYQAFAELQTPLDAERGDGIRREPLSSAEELAALIEGTDGRRYPNMGG